MFTAQTLVLAMLIRRSVAEALRHHTVSTGTLALDGCRDRGSDHQLSRYRWRALTFTPLANDNGAGYDSFEFTVNDGVADSSASSTMTIDVTAVNDLPTATDNTVTATEDTAFVFAEQTLALPMLKRINCRALPSRRCHRQARLH